jgi:hypothetical protein
MTDLHAAFQSLVSDDPPTTIDPRAAVTTGRRRRLGRQRWATGGVAAVVVVAAVGFVGLPHLGLTGFNVAGPAGTTIPWIATEGTRDVPSTSGRPAAAPGLRTPGDNLPSRTGDLDVTATRAAAERVDVPALLGQPAAGPADLVPVDLGGGSLQLSYRAASATPVVVHIVIEGPKGFATDPMLRCPIYPTVTAQSEWPAVTSLDSGAQATSSGAATSAGRKDNLSWQLLCRRGPVTFASLSQKGDVRRTLAIRGAEGGALSVSITSAAGDPSPVSVAQAMSALDALKGLLVFVGGLAPNPTPTPSASSSAGPTSSSN